jgi:hypothetical protein
MTLTTLVRKLERQLKTAEKLARRYDTEARTLKNRLVTVAGAIGKAMAGKSGKRKMSAAGRARIRAAQKKRWAKFHAKKK